MRRPKLKFALLAALGFLRSGGRARKPKPIVGEEGGDPRAELIAGLLLLGAAACAVMFVVVYALDWPNLTQWLGLCLGGCLLLIAAALIYAGETFVPTEEVEEDSRRASTPRLRPSSTRSGARASAASPVSGSC